MLRELVPVLAEASPDIVFPVSGCFHIFIGAHALLLHLVSSHLGLINLDDVHVEFANFLAAVLEPVDLEALVDVELVLLRIGLEQLRLRYDVVLLLLFFLLVDEGGVLLGAMSALG